MVIDLPKYLDFSDFPEVYRILEGESRAIWEISVPPEDSIAWSIVLSYLCSVQLTRKIARRLQVLSSSCKDLKKISQVIRKFNPFINRFSCFYDEYLKKIVQDFKKKLNFENLIDERDMLFVASDFLECSIFAIYKDDQNRCLRFSKNQIYSRSIIIFIGESSGNEEETAEKGKRFSFGLETKYGLKKKENALRCFLRGCKISKKTISKIKNVVNKEDPFLIALLKNGLGTVVSDLYKIPYIISKLEEAGYETDPRYVDQKGFSAFYYALFSGEPQICYQLYDFAANCCFKSQRTYRNPDAKIVSNLYKIGEILVSDFLKSSETELSEKSKTIFRNLFSINKYVLEINKKVLKIKSEINYNDSVENVVFRASQQLDIVTAVLETYLENCDIFYTVQQKYEEVDMHHLKNYSDYKNYCDMVDLITSLIFYDNIFLLKKQLSLRDNKEYATIESEFFILLLSNKYFDEIKDKETFKELELQSEAHFRSPYEIPLQIRQSAHEKIKKFRTVLKETNASIGSLRKAVPMDEFPLLLSSYPEIKDYLQLERLKYYLRIARDLNVSDMKSVFALERILQVIGECITTDPENEASVKNALLLHLPEEIGSKLHHLRNMLSHFKSSAFLVKFAIEKNFCFFASIKKDINNIEKYLKPFFHIQTLKKNDFIFEFLKKAFRFLKISDTFVSYARAIYNETPKKYLSDIHIIFSILLEKLNETLKNKTTKRNFGQIKQIVLLLKNAIQWIFDSQKPVLNSFLGLHEISKSFNELDTCENFIMAAPNFEKKCKDYIKEYKDTRQNIDIIKLESIKNIEILFDCLKGLPALTDNDIDDIRKEIPHFLIKEVTMKKKIIKSIEDGFTLNEEELLKCKQTYLPEKSWEKLQKLYRNKNVKALNILQIPHPVEQLEKMFAQNSIKVKQYAKFCEIMQFSNGTKNKFLKLVPDNIKVNRLACLLNRIEWLRKLLIEEDVEIHKMWKNIKSKKSQQYLFEKIVANYLNNATTQAAVEMLFFDCMILFENEKNLHLWIKSSQLYTGIKLRNVIAHGDVLLENICGLLDTADLSSHYLHKVIRLIKHTDIIKAINKLCVCADKDFMKFQNLIKSKEKEEHSELRTQLIHNANCKKYLQLLPFEKEQIKSLIDDMEKDATDTPYKKD